MPNPSPGSVRLESWKWLKTIRATRFGRCTRSRFAGCVYVLHCFQKKSKSGIKTPQADLDLIKLRLKAAERDFAAWKFLKE